MRDQVEIDYRYSPATTEEIGERLRVALIEDSELPPNLRILLDRFRERDDPSHEHDD